jgi:release factor glutamine methyltransferase
MEPIQYIRGDVDFLGCKIDLSKRPLIPRQETEFWVGRAIARVLEDGAEQKRCLDLFSGSGCVAVAVLEKTGVLLCDIADSQDNCLQQVKINCELNGIDSTRYKIIKSDVFSNIRGKYDYILANPPYVAKDKINEVGESVLEFEPHSALFGGKDGMLVIEKFLEQAKNYLNPDGVIFMEFSPEQKKEIEKILKEQNYKNWKFNKDQFDRWRWVMVQS